MGFPFGGQVTTFIGRHKDEELGVRPICHQEGFRHSELPALVEFCVPTDNGPVEFNDGENDDDNVENRPLIFSCCTDDNRRPKDEVKPNLTDHRAVLILLKRGHYSVRACI